MPFYPTLQLKANRNESLERHHPWVFSGALRPATTKPNDGEIVDVVDAGGAFIARGYYESGSIAVRVLTFDPNEMIDEAFWNNRIGQAYRLRSLLHLTGVHQAYRLANGEGDDLPGLIVDVYGSTAVLQAHTCGIHQRRHLIAHAIIQATDGAVSSVYSKSEGILNAPSALKEDSDGLLIGDRVDESPIQEHGLSFIPDIRHGQKTGFFLDQRDNRIIIGRYAEGRRVLNMFCYTGGFSLHALSGGALYVESVDSSPKAMSITRKNVELNYPGAEGTRHLSVEADAFAYLDDMAPNTFDFIILDPPAFAKRRGVTHNALQGYRRINSTAIRKICPGGLLATFSCSQVVTPTMFRQSVFTAALQAGRRVRVLHQFSQAPDHPVNIYHPEGEYLKGLLLYVE